jgi:hypothetical protein
MGIDPHAVARIHAREALEELEKHFIALADSNSNVSAAGLSRLAVLRRQLDRCTECHSRQRSIVLLMWVLREAAALVVRVIENLPRFHVACPGARWSIDETGRGNQESSQLEGLQSAGVRKAA